MAALTLAFCRSDMALGQFSSQPGTFGYRVLGQPLVPTQGMFGGGIQTNMAGSFLFLGRSNGGNDFATPWRHPYQSVIDQAIAALPPAQLSLPPQQPVGACKFAPPAGTLTPAVQIGPPSQLPAARIQRPRVFSRARRRRDVRRSNGAAWNYALGEACTEQRSCPALSRTCVRRNCPPA